MNTEEIIKLTEITPYILENNLALVDKGDDFNNMTVVCCDKKKFKPLKGSPWTYPVYCESCKRITMVYPQDRMGGSYQDPYEIWETPNENNIFIDFTQINSFLDFCSKNNYSNVWQASNDYKETIRKLLK